MYKGSPYGEPFVLKQGGYPINKTINDTCRNAVHDNGSCDFEHISADAEDKALCLCQLRTHYFVFY